MGGHAKCIYVQIDIVGEMDRIWQLTQTPELHQRWDMRFTEIHYLPRPDPVKPQQFLYTTRIGFGLQIRGQGETLGSFDGHDGQRSSALKFWSEDQKSLIRDGSGYWKYVPLVDQPRTIRFFTGYSYSVRFGMAGRVFDCLVFRPLMGWATAWSFDRLRLWIEADIPPETSMRGSLIYFTARMTLAVIWLYEGLVPKLLIQHPGELAMIHAAGVSMTAARGVCIAVGLIEVAIGLALLFIWRSALPLWFTLVVMPLATLVVAATSSSQLISPFNVIVVNLSVFALALIALISAGNLPSAWHCVRQPTRGQL